MDLQRLAESDLAFTLEGDGQRVTLVNPDGVGAELNAISCDISLMIDPDTGVPVSGRNANAALRIASITAAGLTMPQGIEDGATVPWLVMYETVTGEMITAKVLASNPDRAVGVITLKLGFVR